MPISARTPAGGSCEKPVALQITIAKIAQNIPLLAEEGWPKAGVVSSAETSRRPDHPVCASASLGASTPPLRGGEYCSLIIVSPSPETTASRAQSECGQFHAVDQSIRTSRGPRFPDEAFARDPLAG